MSEGLWVEGLDDTGVVVVVRSTAQTVASLGAVSRDTIARAKLMASAPEQQEKIDALAEALERLAPRDCALVKCPTNCPWCRARAALRAIGRIP